MFSFISVKIIDMKCITVEALNQDTLRWGHPDKEDTFCGHKYILLVCFLIPEMGYLNNQDTLLYYMEEFHCI